MSWCTGGEISAMPGCAWRSARCAATTLTAGSWPPSPGFEPCAILICSSSAERRYAGVTPNRADATCLMRAAGPVAAAADANRSGGSPPSPLLLRPPMRFMPIATLRCASGDSAPIDIAAVKKRRRMASTDSTRSSGIDGRGFHASRSRIDTGWRASTSAVNARYASPPPGCAVLCSWRTIAGS